MKPISVNPIDFGSLLLLIYTTIPQLPTRICFRKFQIVVIQREMLQRLEAEFELL